jgi:hypothetical protein
MGVGNRVMWLVPPLGGSSRRRFARKGSDKNNCYTDRMSQK